MTYMDLAIRRLFHQHLNHQKHTSPKELVGWMGAVQAQDFPLSKWAIGFAGVAIDEENPLKAARLFGAAEVLSQKWGYTIWNATRKMQEFIFQNLEKDPRQKLIEAEKKAGAARTIEKARDYALQENK